ncbi:hypothetical protein CDD80_542 [Ophiocordyceps camponoti-rufipedis]|uniref:Protein-arginine deiminase C-terminal domain-containing protein n=1 Tax=Ophiocordyceps camponoti-rufipedis TaxID=2004952 RepID=A0A2C5YHC6_9HYPO|nr:hypothetical protein CDD80_542 [Ophiocordyceps camponoti-rufipedis]
MGTTSGSKDRPNVMKFLEAQEAQAPIEVDLSWILFGHADEVFTFSPVESKRGWVMMVNDPLLGLKVLENASSTDEKAQVVSRPKLPDDRKEPFNHTISELIGKASFKKFQEQCAEAITACIDTLKRETGLEDAEIIRLPAVFRDKGEPLRRPQQPRRSARAAKQDAAVPDETLAPHTSLENLKNHKRDFTRLQRRAISLYSTTANIVLLSGNQILASKPWGPVINGTDMMETAVTAAYAKAGYTVRFVDDMDTVHPSYGNIHCASNVIRDWTTSAAWWKTEGPLLQCSR